LKRRRGRERAPVPRRSETVGWKVVAWPVYRSERALALARRWGPLEGPEGRVRPKELLAGAYTSGRAKLVALLFRRKAGDAKALAERAARLLEARKGLELAWAVGSRDGRALLLVLTRARDPETGRVRDFQLKPGDLAAVLKLMPNPARERERERERGRGRER